MDPYSLYYSAIYSALYEVWQQPSGMAGRGLSVTALLRVARDGSILEKRIIRKSGNSIMDSSVQNALEAVNRFPAFPPELGLATKDITVEFMLAEDQM
jgi:TonB family protein